MSRPQLIAWCFIGLLLFIGYQALHLFAPFFRTICWAAILAFAFYPVYDSLRAAFGRRQDTLAALATTLLVFLIVVVPLILLIFALARQAIDLYQVVSLAIQQGWLERAVGRLHALPLVRSFEDSLVHLELVKERTSAWMLESAKTLANAAAQHLGAVTKHLFLSLLHGLLTFALVFVFLKRGAGMVRSLYVLAPLEERVKRLLFTRLHDTLAASVRGQLLTSVTQAALATGVYGLLGFPLFVVLGTLTFVATFIPIGGSALVWFPLVLYLIAAQEYARAITLFALGAGVISLIDNILKPVFIGQRTKLPYLLLLFGMLGGVMAYGLLGIVLAPVILSLLVTLVKVYREKYLA